MRCQFCGWDTPDSNGNCEKCGKPMHDESSDSAKVVNNEVFERPTSRQSTNGVSDFKATIRERKNDTDKTSEENKHVQCPECGYELENGVCPSCGYEINLDKKDDKKTIKTQNDCKKTIRPRRKGEKEGSFKLTPISEDSGQPEGESIRFDGNEIVLNRNNTDPKNKTISSHNQASIVFEDGKWTISDQSDYKTTFVQAARKVELQNGDLILVGNQLYQFDNIKE